MKRSYKLASFQFVHERSFVDDTLHEVFIVKAKTEDIKNEEARMGAALDEAVANYTKTNLELPNYMFRHRGWQSLNFALLPLFRGRRLIDLKWFQKFINKLTEDASDDELEAPTQKTFQALADNRKTAVVVRTIYIFTFSI